MWVEMSAAEAAAQGMAEGDMVEVATRRGAVRGSLRVSAMRDGVVFLSFHYGYWDTQTGAARAPGQAGRAANKATLTAWDPVSKQPLFKTAACRARRVAPGGGRHAPAPTTGASAPVDLVGAAATAGGSDAPAAQRLPDA
ncbi:hypothetical protein Ssi02_47100 [Sinosporangium siamense]|uniref:Molybdopterin dinucleotide-binding domain-containing protein n=2 Tax=Sinosporangium siamense TaxID=1367973 RepID=A0A919RM31_9ACTN|nr:hypothetical protein Ssi02_47100 [Sinosporangium siamense]